MKENRPFSGGLRLWNDILLGLGFRLLNGEQLDVKYQRGIGTNASVRSAAFAVCQIRWYEELPFGACGHELQSLSPAFDHAIHREFCRSAVLGGAVKLSPVDQSAGVVALHGVSGCGLGTGAFLQNFVL